MTSIRWPKMKGDAWVKAVFLLRKKTAFTYAYLFILGWQMDVTVLGAYCSTVYTVFETNPSFVSSGISCWNIPQAMRNIHSLLYLLLGWTETKICLASKNRTLEQIRPILSKAQFFCQIFFTVISYSKVISCWNISQAMLNIRCLLSWTETQNPFSQHELQATRTSRIEHARYLTFLWPEQQSGAALTFSHTTGRVAQTPISHVSLIASNSTQDFWLIPFIHWNTKTNIPSSTMIKIIWKLLMCIGPVHHWCRLFTKQVDF